MVGVSSFYSTETSAAIIQPTDPHIIKPITIANMLPPLFFLLLLRMYHIIQSKMEKGCEHFVTYEAYIMR